MATTQTSPRAHHNSLMLPILLVTVGMMFLADEFVPGWGFGKTWPVLLVVIGVVKLLGISQPPRPPEGPRV